MRRSNRNVGRLPSMDGRGRSSGVCGPDRNRRCTRRNPEAVRWRLNGSDGRRSTLTASDCSPCNRPVDRPAQPGMLGVESSLGEAREPEAVDDLFGVQDELPKRSSTHWRIQRYCDRSLPKECRRFRSHQECAV